MRLRVGLSHIDSVVVKDGLYRYFVVDLGVHQRRLYKALGGL